MFRNSEIEALKRGQSLQVGKHLTASTETQVHGELNGLPERSGSPASDVSSLEDDLVGLARTRSATPTRPAVKSQLSRDTQVSSSRAAVQARQRNGAALCSPPPKRKWEAYIEQSDQIGDAMTHRRIARELDEQLDTTIELDY